VKDDVETPPAPPKKRKHLEQALDVHLAIWANDESLPPSARKRAQDERDRRKADAKRGEVAKILVMVPREGKTPQQRAYHDEEVVGSGELYWWSSKTDYHEMVKKVDQVVAFVKEQNAPTHPPPGSVWEAVQYARHRKLPLKVILPNGVPL